MKFCGSSRFVSERAKKRPADWQGAESMFLSFYLNGLPFRKLDRFFFREVKSQNSVFEFCLHIFFCQALADVEASAHRTGITFLMNKFTLLVLFLFFYTF